MNGVLPHEDPPHQDSSMLGSILETSIDGNLHISADVANAEVCPKQHLPNQNRKNRRHMMQAHGTSEEDSQRLTQDKPQMSRTKSPNTLTHKR